MKHKFGNRHSLDINRILVIINIIITIKIRALKMMKIIAMITKELCISKYF